MPLRPGDSIERYTILGLLGKGGMGEVYRARDTRLQRMVALKVLHDDDAESDVPSTGGAMRILREARAAAALEHPNVVAIHDVGEADGEGGRRIAYLAMELIKGQSLRACLGGDDGGRLPFEERLRILKDVARALAAAHAIGLVHRDIKPENVMVRGDGTVKVLDFGLAKRVYSIVDPTSTTEALILSTLTSHGASAGTPYYMAPEQMRGEDLDGRADQFAWGVVAYELLAGTPPWGVGIDGLCLVSSVLSMNPERLDRLDASIPVRVADVVARAMAKSRSARFATMSDVVAALEGNAPVASPLAHSLKAVPVASGFIASVPPEGTRSSAPTPDGVRRRATRPAAMVAAFAAIGLLAFLLVRSRTTASVPVERGDAAQASRCTSSSACTRANGGAPSRCREDGACAVLASEDCVVHAGAGVAESDDTVWFGAMLPPKGDPSGDGEAELRAIDLARQDFDQMMSGFTRLRGDAYAQVHPFGVIACDDTKDAMRAGRHLVEDVRVPAIIGFRSAAEIIDVGSALLVPNGVVAVASLSTSPLVTVLPNRPDQPRLVWRTTYSSAETAKAMGHIVPDLLEPQIRATPGVLAASAPMRVALVRMTSRGGSTFNELLFKALRYNGKSALENGTDFRELVFDETDPSKVDGDAKQLVVALDRFAPHVIILVADQGMRIIEPLERAWTHASYRPRYLFMTPLTQALLDWMGSSLERRRRFFGLATLSTTSVNARFVMHYNEGATTKVTRTYAPNSSYDAFYVLAYATYALREKPVTGTNLARAIARLVPPGKTFDVGPADIFDAYSALRRGENIDLNGATGSLDFDLDTGEAPFDQAVLCAALDDKGRPVDSVESGVVFHSSPSRLEGTLRCP